MELQPPEGTHALVDLAYRSGCHFIVRGNESQLGILRHTTTTGNAGRILNFEAAEQVLVFSVASPSSSRESLILDTAERVTYQFRGETLTIQLARDGWARGQRGV